MHGAQGLFDPVGVYAESARHSRFSLSLKGGAQRLSMTRTDHRTSANAAFASAAMGWGRGA
ncbi:hypothetical protein DESC_940036 [Desulfosarcina cetonica]|nr:hypothetical protein DESC_940036 [Desulfosarcina cetonica]